MFVWEARTGIHQEQKTFLLGVLDGGPTPHEGQYSDPPQLVD